MESLEAVNASLEENVGKTRTLMAAMQAELQRIHSEYGVASSTLHQLLSGSTVGGGVSSQGPGSVSGSVAPSIARQGDYFGNPPHSATPTNSYRR